MTEDRPPQFKSFNELEHIVQHIRLFGNAKEDNFAKLWWQHDVTWCGEIQRNQPFRKSEAMEDFNLKSYRETMIWQKKQQGEYPAKYKPTNDIKPIDSAELKIASGNVSWFEMSVSSGINELMIVLKDVSENVAYRKFTHIQLRKENDDDISRWKYHEKLGVFKDLKKDEYINE